MFVIVKLPVYVVVKAVGPRASEAIIIRFRISVVIRCIDVTSRECSNRVEYAGVCNLTFNPLARSAGRSSSYLEVVGRRQLVVWVFNAVDSIGRVWVVLYNEDHSARTCRVYCGGSGLRHKNDLLLLGNPIIFKSGRSLSNYPIVLINIRPGLRPNLLNKGNIILTQILTQVAF